MRAVNISALNNNIWGVTNALVGAVLHLRSILSWFLTLSQPALTIQCRPTNLHLSRWQSIMQVPQVSSIASSLINSIRILTLIWTSSTIFSKINSNRTKLLLHSMKSIDLGQRQASLSSSLRCKCSKFNLRQASLRGPRFNSRLATHPCTKYPNGTMQMIHWSVRTQPVTNVSTSRIQKDRMDSNSNSIGGSVHGFAPQKWTLLSVIHRSDSADSFV